MLVALVAAAVLVVATTFIHYELLAGLSARLPVMRMNARLRVVTVILLAFLAHALEILVYGGVYYAASVLPSLGALQGGGSMPPFLAALYFSAETYTSLGFGDLTPSGPLRLLAGVEALNGLLLIAWSASFTYLSMERFWTRGE